MLTCLLALLLSPAIPVPANPAASLPTPVRLTHVVHAYSSWGVGDREIVFQSNAAGNWDLYVIGSDGSGLRQLTFDRAADITPVWSPDGKRLAFVSERDGNREVYTCAADGSAPVRLTHDPAPDIHPAWSADGMRIMFSSARGNASPEDFDIHEMSADGSDVRRITAGPEVDTYSSRSPDGQRIVTRRVLTDGNNEVFVLDRAGGGAVNLTGDPASYDGWPTWSPDGKRIVFASGPAGRSPMRINVVNADGTGRRLLTDAWGPDGFVYDTQPAWSRDGKRVAFTRYRPGVAEIAELCVVDVLGAEAGG